MIIGLKRVMCASVVVVDEGLEATSSGKITGTTNKNIWRKLECIERLQMGDNNIVSPNMHPSENTTNPHIALLILYQARHIVSNFYPVCT